MKKLIAIWNYFEETIAVLLFTLLLVFGFFQIVSRFGLINIPLDWTEELSRYAFIALVYISASLAIAQRRHVRVEIIENIIPKHMYFYLALIVDLIWAIFNFIIAYEGYLISEESFGNTTPVLEWDMGIIYLIIPFTFTLMGVRVLCNMYEDIVNKIKEGQ